MTRIKTYPKSKNGKMSRSVRELLLLRALALREHAGLTYTELRAAVGYKEISGVTALTRALSSKGEITIEVGEDNDIRVFITDAGLTRIGSETDGDHDGLWWQRVLIPVQATPSTGREFTPPTLRRRAGA